MTTEEAREYGYARGYALGIEIEIEPEPDQDAEATFFAAVGEAEEIGRQFSPFEILAHAINESDDAEELWETFDAAIMDGARAAWKERQHEFMSAEELEDYVEFLAPLDDVEDVESLEEDYARDVLGIRFED